MGWGGRGEADVDNDVVDSGGRAKGGGEAPKRRRRLRQLRVRKIGDKMDPWWCRRWRRNDDDDDASTTGGVQFVVVGESGNWKNEKCGTGRGRRGGEKTTESGEDGWSVWWGGEREVKIEENERLRRRT